MTEITKFSVTEIDEINSSLYADEKKVGFSLPIRQIEHQFQLENGWYLLFCTDNCPFEEQLTIVLLNGDLNLLDQLSLGWAYTPGVLREITFIDPFYLTFLFAAAKPFCLKIEKDGFFLYNPFHAFGWHPISRLFNNKFLYLTHQG